MSFKMRCPKCQGLDYSIERDNRTFGAVAQAFELVFHCRCGKQMFGEQILKEYEVQKKVYDVDGSGSTDDDTTPEAPSHALLKEAAEGREEQAPPAPKPLTPKASAIAAAPDAKPKAKAAKAAKPVEVGAAVGGNMCTWPGCEKTARKNSKYCSRACSNKNARHRHKLRVKTDDDDDDSAE
jgi:hypothetical protein